MLNKCLVVFTIAALLLSSTVTAGNNQANKIVSKNYLSVWKQFLLILINTKVLVHNKLFY